MYSRTRRVQEAEGTRQGRADQLDACRCSCQGHPEPSLHLPWGRACLQVLPECLVATGKRFHWGVTAQRRIRHCSCQRPRATVSTASGSFAPAARTVGAIATRPPTRSGWMAAAEPDRAHDDAADEHETLGADRFVAASVFCASPSSARSSLMGSTPGITPVIADHPRERPQHSRTADGTPVRVVPDVAMRRTPSIRRRRGPRARRPGARSRAPRCGHAVSSGAPRVDPIPPEAWTEDHQERGAGANRLAVVGRAGDVR